VGHEASHAQTGAWRKITAVYGGPPPYESRTTNITASLWLDVEPEMVSSPIAILLYSSLSFSV